MAAELARLGIIVDATGARREIQLTRDELIKLANSGKATSEAFKNVVPPDAVPRIHALTESLKRMQEAHRQSVANAFGAQLAKQMDMAEQSAMRLQRGLEGVRAAQQRMQQAAIQARAAAQASQLAVLDPFQGGGGGGIAAATQAITQAATRAGHASFEMGKLRQGMTSLAIAAGALPGPLGRIASTLAPLAIGGAVTVAVLAGITAITFAWQKFREEDDKAAAMMEKLRAGETGMSAGAMRSRMGLLDTEIADLNAKRAASGQRLGRDPSTGMDRFAPKFTADDQTRFAELQARYAELATAVRRSETTMTRTVEEEAEKRAQAYEREYRRKLSAGYDRYADPYAGLPFRGPGQPITAMVAAREAYSTAISAAMGSAPSGGATQLDAQSMFQLRLHVDASTRALQALTDAATDAAIAHGADRRSAKFHLGGYAVGMVAERAGPFGGAISGVAGGVMAGQPWMAAAAGVTGLIDGLIGLSNASRQAAEHTRQLEIQFVRFIDAQRLALGDITDAEAQARELQRAFAEQRRAIEAQMRALEQIDTTNNDFYRELQRRLKDLNELERRRLEQLAKEGDAIDRINNAMRNAPSGFYLEKYVRDQAGLVANPTLTRINAPTVNASSGGGMTVVVSPGAIVIDGALPPVEMAKKMVAGLRMFANATMGNGGTLADAMERLH